MYSHKVNSSPVGHELQSVVLTAQLDENMLMSSKDIAYIRNCYDNAHANWVWTKHNMYPLQLWLRDIKIEENLFYTSSFLMPISKTESLTFGLQPSVKQKFNYTKVYVS